MIVEVFCVVDLCAYTYLTASVMIELDPPCCGINPESDNNVVTIVQNCYPCTSVMNVSVLFTELHEYAYPIVLVVV